MAPRKPRKEPLSYSEKLKDPRWQKKRLEVLERAGWKCEGCGDAANTLHVHHGHYVKGREPWEYPAHVLWSLCEDCHENAESARCDAYLELACINPIHVGPHKVLRDAFDESESLRRGSLIRAGLGPEACAARTAAGWPLKDFVH